MITMMGASGGMGWFHRIRKAWPIAALCVFYLYLAFHALSGNQGLVSWVDYENEIAKNRSVLEAAQLERETLEARTDALRASRLDLDALDIKAREQAFLARPQDVTIWLNQTP